MRNYYKERLIAQKRLVRKVVRTLDVNAMLEEMRVAVREMLPSAMEACILLLDPEALNYTQPLHCQLYERPVNCLSCKRSRPAVTDAITQKRCILTTVSDPIERPDESKIAIGQELAFPIFQGDEILAVISVVSRPDTKFNSKDFLLLEDFAEAASNIIINAKEHCKISEETVRVSNMLAGVEAKLASLDTVLSNLNKVIDEIMGGVTRDPSLEWLIPHMVKKLYTKGEVLFSKGDRADRLFYIEKGSLRLIEIDEILGENTLIGETGIFSPLQKRTVSVVCQEDCDIYELESDRMITLFHENPSFVFELLQLTIRRSLENFKKTVAEKERVEADLRIAHEIQRSVMPCKFPPFPDRREFDIFASMEAAREVGGDFYDFFLVNEDTLCFIIGDVSGKGVSAALFMMITKALLKTMAVRDLPPDEILFQVNNIIAPDNENALFVTILCAILNTETGELVIGNAGHNPPLIRKGNGEFQFIQLPVTCVLGPMEDMRFASVTLMLTPHDTIFFYTDGVTEAMNPEGELFENQRLQEALSKGGDRDVTELINGVSEDVRNFVRNAPQSDDVTMLALRYHSRRRE